MATKLRSRNGIIRTMRGGERNHVSHIGTYTARHPTVGGDVSQRDSQYATPVLRDVKRGDPTEVEYILGFMLNKASEANIAHRTLLLAYTHIKTFEQRRAAGDLP